MAHFRKIAISINPRSDGCCNRNPGCPISRRPCVPERVRGAEHTKQLPGCCRWHCMPRCATRQLSSIRYALLGVAWEGVLEGCNRLPAMQESIVLPKSSARPGSKLGQPRWFENALNPSIRTARGNPQASMASGARTRTPATLNLRERLIAMTCAPPQARQSTANGHRRYKYMGLACSGRRDRQRYRTNFSARHAHGLALYFLSASPREACKQMCCFILDDPFSGSPPDQVRGRLCGSTPDRPSQRCSACQRNNPWLHTASCPGQSGVL